MCCSHDPVRPYQGSSTNMSTPYTKRNLPWPGVGAGILSINYSREGRTHTTSCQSSKMQRLFFQCWSLTCTFTFTVTDPDVIKNGGRGSKDTKIWYLLSSETHPCLPISVNISQNFHHIVFRGKHLPCWRFWGKRILRYRVWCLKTCSRFLQYVLHSMSYFKKSNG